MSGLPKGWARTRFGDCATLVNGRAYSQHELLATGVPVLRIQNLNGGDRWYYSDLDLPEDKYCSEGDLLFAWSATFGPYKYGGPKAIFHYHIWNVHPEKALDKNFGYLLLKEITEEVKAAAHGVAMPHMTKAGMEAWDVPLPPLSEQRRIVAKVEALMAHSRRAKEALAAIPPLLDQLRQSILAAAFRGNLTADWRAQHPDVEPATELLQRIRAERRRRWEQAELAKLKAKGKHPKDDRWKAKYEEPEPVDDSELPELPEGWCWAALEEVAWLETGGTPPGKVEDCYGGKTPFMKPTDLDAGFSVVNARTFLSSRGVSYVEVVPAGTVLVTCIGSIGKVGLARTDCAFNQQINSASPCSGVGAEYLYWCLSGPFGQDWIRSNASATTLPILNKGRFARMPVPLCSKSEQTEVEGQLRRARERWSVLDEMVAPAAEAVTGLDSAILAKAFRGELVPQDPNDEPASVLLEWIRAGKDAGGPGRTGQKAAGRGRRGGG